MLKVTKKTDYGLTFLAALAKNPDTHLSLRQIANAYKLPYKFIGQVAASLLDAGLITSKEGATGGYRLAKSAPEITLKEVMTVLDGPVVKIDCLSGKNCARQTHCGHRAVMVSLAAGINEALNSKTLADILK